MIHNKNIQAIALDLDGTLLRGDKTISAYTQAVLKACKKRGIRIIVATARPLRAMQQYCTAVDFDAFVVSNGAKVFYGDLQRTHQIAPKTARQLLTTLQGCPGMRITLETGENAYSNRPIEDYRTNIRDDLVSIADQEDILKIIVHLDTPDTAATVKAALTEDLHHSISAGYMLQIMDNTASKWNGIRTVLDLLGGKPEETVYFGDDHDDVVPIQMCGAGVAVANAIPEVKAVADHIAGSNEADGVAAFLDRFLLRNR